MNLAEFLEKHQCEYAKMEEHLGVPPGTIDTWCRGVGFPDPYQSVEISKCLGCDLKELYTAIIDTPVNLHF